MNIDHRLWMALENMPEDAPYWERVQHLAEWADCTFAYAAKWYGDWMAKQEAPSERRVFSSGPLKGAEIKNDIDDEIITSIVDNALEELQAQGQAIDAINPPHYQQGNVQAIEAIEAALGEEQFKGYLRGNVLKYIWRTELKGLPLEQLKKADWYLQKLIEFYQD